MKCLLLLILLAAIVIIDTKNVRTTAVPQKGGSNSLSACKVEGNKPNSSCRVDKSLHVPSIGGRRIFIGVQIKKTLFNSNKEKSVGKQLGPLKNPKDHVERKEVIPVVDPKKKVNLEKIRTLRKCLDETKREVLPDHQDIRNYYDYLKGHTNEAHTHQDFNEMIENTKNQKDFHSLYSKVRGEEPKGFNNITFAQKGDFSQSQLPDIEKNINLRFPFHVTDSERPMVDGAAPYENYKYNNNNEWQNYILSPNAFDRMKSMDSEGLSLSENPKKPLKNLVHVAKGEAGKFNSIRKDLESTDSDAQNIYMKYFQKSGNEPYFNRKLFDETHGDVDDLMRNVSKPEFDPLHHALINGGMVIAKKPHHEVDDLDSIKKNTTNGDFAIGGSSDELIFKSHSNDTLSSKLSTSLSSLPSSPELSSIGTPSKTSQPHNVPFVVPKISTFSTCKAAKKNRTGKTINKEACSPCSKKATQILGSGSSESPLQIANKAAEQAKNFRDSQDKAGTAASQAIQIDLAERALQSAKSAEAVLAAKMAIVDQLEEAVRSAKCTVTQRAASLEDAEIHADLTIRLVNDAKTQLCLLTKATSDAMKLLNLAQKVSAIVQKQFNAKISHLKSIKDRLQKLLCMLDAARKDYELTRKITYRAICSAQEARQRVAQLRCRKSIF